MFYFVCKDVFHRYFKIAHFSGIGYSYLLSIGAIETGFWGIFYREVGIFLQDICI